MCGGNVGTPLTVGVDRGWVGRVFDASPWFWCRLGSILRHGRMRNIGADFGRCRHCKTIDNLVAWDRMHHLPRLTGCLVQRRPRYRPQHPRVSASTPRSRPNTPRSRPDPNINRAEERTVLVAAPGSDGRLHAVPQARNPHAILRNPHESFPHP